LTLKGEKWVDERLVGEALGAGESAGGRGRAFKQQRREEKMSPTLFLV
jgi:hypothetical protein